jgi:hypothetical protein
VRDRAARFDRAARWPKASDAQPRREPEAREIASFVARCGAHRLVVRAEHVSAVSDRGELEGPIVDAHALLGVTPDAGAEVRALHVGKEGRDGLWLAVGGGLQLRRLSPHAFQPLPRWLPRVSEVLPIATLVDLEDGFAFEIDVARMLPRTAEPMLDDSHG